MATIRKGDVANVNELRSLAIKIFRETFESANNPADFKLYMDGAFALEKIKSEYQEPGSQYFEAVEGDQLVGYARIRENDEVNHLIGNNHLELMRLYVDASWQGKGIAVDLLKACEDYARQQGKEWIWLGVWELNPKAQHFYRKNGFEKFSEHKFMLGHDEQTDWLMKKKVS